LFVKVASICKVEKVERVEELAVSLVPSPFDWQVLGTDILENNNGPWKKYPATIVIT
jgi:hypothetical protein